MSQCTLPTAAVSVAGPEETVQGGWDMAETAGAAKCHSEQATLWTSYQNHLWNWNRLA